MVSASASGMIDVLSAGGSSPGSWRRRWPCPPASAARGTARSRSPRRPRLCGRRSWTISVVASPADMRVRGRRPLRAARASTRAASNPSGSVRRLRDRCRSTRSGGTTRRTLRTPSPGGDVEHLLRLVDRLLEHLLPADDASRGARGERRRRCRAAAAPPPPPRAAAAGRACRACDLGELLGRQRREVRRLLVEQLLLRVGGVEVGDRSRRTGRRS